MHAILAWLLYLTFVSITGAVIELAFSISS